MPTPGKSALAKFHQTRAWMPIDEVDEENGVCVHTYYVRSPISKGQVQHGSAHVQRDGV